MKGRDVLCSPHLSDLLKDTHTVILTVDYAQ